MKNTILTLLAFLLTFSVQAAEKDLNIIFIGNSICEGATLHDRKAEAPPVKASEYIQQQTGKVVNFKNCGVSGMTTVDFLPSGNRKFPNVVKAAEELYKLPGQLIFSIALGTNDSSDDCYGAPVVPEQYYTNLKAIVDELLLRYPKAKVVLQYPIWYSPTTYNGARYMQKGLNRLKSYIPQIDKLVEHYAQARKQQVFGGSKKGWDFFKENYKLYTTEQGNAGLFYLHPNKEGAMELAKIWSEGILNIVGK